MPTSQPETSEITDILSRRRLAAAFNTLADPDRNNSNDALRLSDTEREVIRQAVSESSHPLAGLASHLVSEWDQADPDDRVAGLLLFAEITITHPRRQQTRGLPTGPGLSR